MLFRLASKQLINANKLRICLRLFIFNVCDLLSLQLNTVKQLNQRKGRILFLFSVCGGGVGDVHYYALELKGGT